eukprot:COSAG01_NODE_31763_length_591_cov_51.272358_1_plen_64_part_10
MQLPPRVQPLQPAADDRFRGDIDGTLTTRGGWTSDAAAAAACAAVATTARLNVTCAQVSPGPDT